MYQESIVQNVKLIIQQAKFEALSHLVRPALPGEPLVVPGLLVGPDVERLPVVVRINSLTEWFIIVILVSIWSQRVNGKRSRPEIQIVPGRLSVSQFVQRRERIVIVL